MRDRKPGALDRTSGAIRLAAQDAGSLIKRGLADFQHVRKARGHGLDARQAKELGSAYMKGLGVDQDDAEAVKWFRCAAEQGDAEAQHRVGFAYMTGRGISQDDAEAVVPARCPSGRRGSSVLDGLRLRERDRCQAE